MLRGHASWSSGSSSTNACDVTVLVTLEVAVDVTVEVAVDEAVDVAVVVGVATHISQRPGQSARSPFTTGLDPSTPSLHWSLNRGWQRSGSSRPLQFGQMVVVEVVAVEVVAVLVVDVTVGGGHPPHTAGQSFFQASILHSAVPTRVV
jgi:hypothetical protein